MTKLQIEKGQKWQNYVIERGKKWLSGKSWPLQYALMSTVCSSYGSKNVARVTAKT